MGNIHDVFKDDDVTGTIIGGEYLVGILTYDGRKQGGELYAECQGELLRLAEEQKAEILKDCGTVAKVIYSMDDAWRLVILNT